MARLGVGLVRLALAYLASYFQELLAGTWVCYGTRSPQSIKERIRPLFEHANCGKGTMTIDDKLPERGATTPRKCIV